MKTIFLIGILFLFLSGCTSFQVEDKHYWLKEKVVKYPHLFGIADKTQPIVTIGEFQEIDFNYELGDAYEFSPDGNCIMVGKTGHYIINLEAFFQDNSPVATSKVAIIITKNGAEVSGSYSETSFTKQYANKEITTFAYVETDVNDIICMEWTGNDADISLTGLNSYADQPLVAKGFINWIHGND